MNKSGGQPGGEWRIQGLFSFFVIQERITKLDGKALHQKVSHSTLQQGGFGCELHCSRFRAFATIWPRWPEAGPQVRWQIHPIMVSCSSPVYSFVQIYYLQVLSTAMPLPTTICSPVLGDSYLLPISNALLRARYRNGEKTVLLWFIECTTAQWSRCQLEVA